MLHKIPLLITFDSSFLSRYLADDTFTVHKLSRFPYLNFEFKSSPSIVFIVLTELDLQGLDAEGLQFLVRELSKLPSQCAIIFLVLPSFQLFSVRMEASSVISQLITLSKSDLPQLLIFDGHKLGNFLGNFSMFSPQLNYLTTSPYSKSFLKLIGQFLNQMLSFKRNMQKKLIITDIDGTLWNGILAESNLNNMSLDENEPIYRSFKDFQHVLVEAKKMGYILAVASKNYPEDIDKFLKDERVAIGLEDFACIKGSWEPKNIQVEEICRELNILVEDVIFLDDNLHERDLLSASFPSMMVPIIPNSPFERPLFLKALLGFENPFATDEDRIRAQSYISQIKRRNISEKLGNGGDWLQSLKPILHARLLDENTIDRALQLSNRTNQFNLNPTRTDRQQLMSLRLNNPANGMYLFSYEDRIGKDGQVGAIGFSCEPGVFTMDSFLLSCRVFGREIEQYMIGFVIELAKKKGFEKVFLFAKDSGRNKIGMEFLKSLPITAVGENRFLVDPNWRPKPILNITIAGSSS